MIFGLDLSVKNERRRLLREGAEVSIVDTSGARGEFVFETDRGLVRLVQSCCLNFFSHDMEEPVSVEHPPVSDLVAGFRRPCDAHAVRVT